MKSTSINWKLEGASNSDVATDSSLRQMVLKKIGFRS